MRPLVVLGAGVLGGGVAFAITGSGSAFSATALPAVLCLVNPEPLNNDPHEAVWPETLATLRRDAASVCAALGGTVDAPDSPFDEPTLLAKLAKLSNDRPRIVFYAGHGQRDTTTNQVSLPVQGGRVPLTKVLEALDAGPKGAKDVWSVLIMNTCQSAFADLRGVKGRVSVIGSGWDKVSAEPNRGDDPDSLTRFGAALAAGLLGRADIEPDGNCDGVITDGEISRFIDDQMARAARRNVNLWRMAPVAAIRRNRAVDLPLVKLRAPSSGCVNAGRAGVPAASPAASIPPGFAVRIEAAVQLGVGVTPDALPPLVAVLAPPAADEIISGLAKVGETVGFQISRIASGDLDVVRSIARVAAAVPIFWLEVRPVGTDAWYFELVRGRDRATTWAAFSQRGLSPTDLVTLVAPRLPRELRVLHLFGRSDGQLRVAGGWTDGAIEGTDWSLLAQGKPVWSPEKLKGLHPDACPDFAGLCFELPSDMVNRLEPLFLRRASP